MAIFHHLFTLLCRGGHTCAMATAAYRSGQCLTLVTRHTDSGAQETHTFDYSNKKGISFSEIFYPFTQGNRPEERWRTSREAFWQHVEDICEGAVDLLAFESVFALPEELSTEKHKELVTTLVQEAYLPRGLLCDVSIHSEHNNNPHVHILCPAWVSGDVDDALYDFLKPLTQESITLLKEEFAQAFCAITNRLLEAENVAARVYAVPRPVYAYEAMRPWL